MTRRTVFRNILTALALSASATTQALEDWPQWRGPHRDGLSAEKNLLKSWPPDGPPLAWRVSGAGEGRGDGPRSTPTVDGARLYVFGASGDLTSLDAASGKIAWTVNVVRDFGGQNIKWGFSESPLVSGDRIIVSPGGSGSAIVAVNKANGKLLWKSEGDTAGYSSAVLHEVGGVRQAIVFTGQRALGLDIDNGRVLWSYDRVSNRVANIATPIARGNHVFLSSDYGTGAALLELTPSAGAIAVREVYFTRDMRNHHASSVLIGDYLYGFSSAILTAMKFDTGKVAWRDRSVGKGSLVFADDRLYLFSEGGVAALAEATPTGYREHGRFSLETGSLPTWTHPVVSNGKLFLRDQDTVYAYDVRSR
jgi:outer membrane protein assembly factor BamB